MAIKHFTLRIDEELLAKFHFACAYVDRSANKQLVQLVKGYISNYERTQGTIELAQLHEMRKKGPGK